MKLYILNPNYEKIAYLDQQDSTLWNIRYNDLGDCEIYVPCTVENLEILKEENYVYREDDDSMFCEIVSSEIETDIEGGDYIIAVGRDMSSILSGRIVRWQITYSGKVCDFIKKIVVDNMITAQQPQRSVSNFVFNDSNFDEFTETVNMNVFTDDLLEVVKSICKTYQYGFKTRFIEETKTIEFSIYKGKNKASISNNEYVEFSPTFSNIISSNYKTDISNYKNLCYVGYKDDQDNLTLLSVYNTATEPQGKARKEMYVDGSNTSREITEAELNQLFNNIRISESTYYAYIGEEEVAVATKNEDKITITDDTYLLLIRILGLNALAERNKTQEFSGVVDIINTYKYKQDYNLGDIVKVINDYGIEADARITEIQESNDFEDGYTVEPKFEYLE